MKISRRLLLASSLLLLSPLTIADGLWSDASDKHNQTRIEHADNVRVLKVNYTKLNATMAPDNVVIALSLPIPNGKKINVTLQEDSVFAPELAKKFPQIKSYIVLNSAGKRIGRASYSHKGLHGLYRYQGELTYLEPLFQKRSEYVTYFQKDAITKQGLAPFENMVLRNKEYEAFASSKHNQQRIGEELITYRLAIATTGEYTQFHGGRASDAVAALNILLTRLNEIFETEVAVRFELVANNDSLIFSSPNGDPYENAPSPSELDLNQLTIDSIIGSDNYDIGHVVGTGGGGLAQLGSVCGEGWKARAFSGSDTPTAKPYFLQVLAHEIGHQLGANHTFNATSGSCGGGNRNAGTSFEPGSGSTLMSYAGLCEAENLQALSDMNFHVASFEEMRNLIENPNFATCGEITALNNSEPTVEAGADYTIPANTPFKLVGIGADSDSGDELTYSWEQFDPNGIASSSAQTMLDNGGGPIFRSWKPVSENYRYIPRLEDVVNGETVIGEAYATTSRSLNFRLTVRDDKGGVATDNMSISTRISSSRFSVTSPNTNNAWVAGSKALLQWNTAGTANAPISCSSVNVEYTTDNGETFVSLATSEPNDGVAAISAPTSVSSGMRLKLSCADSIFYTLSNSFSVVSGSSAPTDSDNDGISDEFENNNGLNPNSASDALADADGDGLSNLEEFLLGTDINNADSDSDGMPDAYEVAYGFNPNDASDANADLDGDGSTNLEEYQEGSDPADAASNADITMDVYRFETGNFLERWEFGSSNAWTRTDAQASTGDYSIVSAAIGDETTTEVSFTDTFAAGSITFDYRVSTEANYDFLQFVVDGEVKTSWSGEIDWSTHTYGISAGLHTISWRYVKDQAVNEGSDAAWIDNVSIPVRKANSSGVDEPVDGDDGNDSDNSGNTTSFVAYDYDGDGSADIAVRRPSNYTQYISNSGDEEIQRITFGRNSTDIPVSGDFDGDGKADVAVRRAETGYWYIKNSSGVDRISGNDDGITRFRFGLQSDDIPVPADYDGDGVTDLAVRRPGTQYWYIRNSSGVDSLTGNEDGISRVQFGRDENDIPVPADYDGDGKADLAVRRASNQFWYIKNSAGTDLISGNNDGITRYRFGTQPDDIPVPADYDGDGKADLAVRRASNQYWYVLNSSGSNYNSERNDGIQRVNFGKAFEDIPIPADYDGDGKADFAVRRASTQYQYVLNSRDSSISRLNFGKQVTDIPVAAPVLTRLSMAEGN